MFPDSIKNIALIAPAGPLAPDLLNSGIESLERAGKIVTIMPHVKKGSKFSYLSASAEERAKDIMDSWLNPNIDMLLAVRGGFGSAHTLPLLDWAKLRTRNMLVAGYSDITALHFGMSRFGVGTPLVAPMVGKLFSLDAYTKQELEQAFATTRKLDGEFKILQSGEVEAFPIVGNLTVSASLCGTPYLPSCRDKIIILEDLNEPEYKIDRYITQLEQNNFFDGCAGIALGGFIDCGDMSTLEQIFRRLCTYTKGPVVMNFPFGHQFPIASLNFAQKLQLSIH